jgi:hypothetical protein
MTGENLAATNEHQESDLKRRSARLDSNAIIQGLERLRECFEQRLVRLEVMARERAAQAVPVPVPVPDRTELELKLQQRIAEIEEAQLRLRTQAERREQEWRAALEQLEGDRALLAEAWVELERERAEASTLSPWERVAEGRVRAGAQPNAAASRVPEGRARASAQPTTSEPMDAANDHVAHTILQQFQALRNDVRRNARGRGAR